MGMAVNKDAHSKLLHGCIHGLGIDIHDALAFLPNGLLTARAQAGGQIEACAERQAAQDEANERMAQFAAHGLIGQIVSAKCIAMQQSDAVRVKVGDENIRQQAYPQAASECLADKEITVAMLKEKGDARRGDAFEEVKRRLKAGWDGGIIPYPDFDKIAQNIDRIGIKQAVFKGDQACGNFRSILA